MLPQKKISSFFILVEYIASPTFLSDYVKECLDIFLKKNSHLPDISDQMPNFFKESYQTYLSEARHQSRQFTLSHNLGYKRWINSKTRIIIFVFIQSPLLAFFCRHRQHFDSTLYFVRVHSKVGYYIVITYLGNK